MLHIFCVLCVCVNSERERERKRLYYRLRKSNMTYEAKNITFHVIRVKVSSDLDVQELYQQMLQSRVHIVVVREIHARIGLGHRYVESMVEYDQRQSIVSKSDTQIVKLV